MLFTLVLRAGVPPGMMGVDGAPATQDRAELELGGAAVQRRGEERMVKVSPRPYRSLLLVASALRHGRHGTAHPRCAVTYVTTTAASRSLIRATCEMSQNLTVERYPLV